MSHLLPTVGSTEGVVVSNISDVHDLCQRISDESDPSKIPEMMLSLRHLLESDERHRQFKLEYILRYWPEVLLGLEMHLRSSDTEQSISR